MNLTIADAVERLITQKLILTPEVEINLFGNDDAELGIGSCVSDVSAGLRLRYESLLLISVLFGVRNSVLAPIRLEMKGKIHKKHSWLLGLKFGFKPLFKYVFSIVKTQKEIL
ncbi:MULTISPECIES: copper resistance protein B [Shewanella]|uniref:copper resistance protein B n=1 Tax=Shewanella TaxID=22 RepID=UPI001F16E7FE|nr:copper resistance protein B [Shewanella psychromarinicola]MCL1082206.1 copper resistance protein B [Shewanella psychromarinicola]